MSDQKQPTRDVREDPASNPKGSSKGDKPTTPKSPPDEVPPLGEHVPTRTPVKAKRYDNS